MITRWLYYRDESPDGTFTGVRSSPVGQFVTHEDHMKAMTEKDREIQRLKDMITNYTEVEAYRR